MQAAAIISLCITVVLLILITGISPRRSRISRYELERRRSNGSTSAGDELEREIVVDDAMTLMRAFGALLLVVCTIPAVLAFGTIMGLVVSMGIALCYIPLAQTNVVRTFVDRLYPPYDAAFMRFVSRQMWMTRVFHSEPSDTVEVTISSREELEHAIVNSGQLLTSDEKKLLKSGIHFSETLVEAAMVPRGAITTVKKADLVGPIMLDELHRTGYSRFPVVDENIDHVIGVLHIRELLSLQDKKSQTVEKVMEGKVFYIRWDQTLNEALSAFLKTRHHLFVVVNELRETAGIITLEDVIETLLGREIVDEFDTHDSLRVVAGREPYPNNSTDKA